jgi:hypothetical protein
LIEAMNPEWKDLFKDIWWLHSGFPSPGEWQKGRELDSPLQGNDKKEEKRHSRAGGNPV